MDTDVTNSYAIDLSSETWLAIDQWIKQRLQIRCTNLEISGMELDETENNRGAIEELKELRALAKPRAVVDEPDSYVEGAL